ncbi:hypothetical protein GCM10010349_35420 [Streptomyces flavofungini]|nr:hypothetical protein GCM10010349_35420 [Streptomyces flavofungini]
MDLTIAPPHVRVKAVGKARKSNVRAIRSVAASGILGSPGFIDLRVANQRIRPGVVSGSP